MRSDRVPEDAEGRRPSMRRAVLHSGQQRKQVGQVGIGYDTYHTLRKRRSGRGRRAAGRARGRGGVAIIVALGREMKAARGLPKYLRYLNLVVIELISRYVVYAYH